MKLVIEAYYETGDSFGTSNDTEILDFEWENEDIVVENAKAIMEHYDVYHAIEGWGTKPEDESYKEKWWYVEPDKWSKVSQSLNLKLDDGTLFQYLCPWCGYFERLISTEIKFREYKFYVN